MSTNTGPIALPLVARLRGGAASVGRFVWHLLQMVLAMEAGMAIYHLLLHTALAGTAFAALVGARPLLDYWLMVASMTIPMIALMRYLHKSTWRACAEMTLVMLVPPAVLTMLTQSDLIAVGTLQALGDPLMILAMAADMLYRRDEHAGHAHYHYAHGGHAPRPRVLRRVLRALIYVVAFVLPIGLVGAAGFSLSLANSVAGTPAALRAAVPQPAPAYDPHKPTVAIVLGDVNDSNDVLGPYALFAESAAYNVYTVASSREPRALTDGLDVLPHYSFAGLEAQLGRGPDIVVVPGINAILEPQNQPVLDWLRRQAKGPGTLFSWCTGAEVLAAAGVLDGLPATTHWGDIDGLERVYPAVRWQRGVRYVDNGHIVTAAGLTSGFDATLHLLEQRHGRALAERIAQSIHYPSLQLVDHPELQQYRPELADAVAMLNGAFTWPKQRAGVWLYNGVGEIDLAAVLEVYGATWTTKLETLAVGPSVTSQHGLQLIPRWQAASRPKLDRVLLPGGRGAALAAAAPELTPERLGAPVVALADPAAPRFAYAVTLEDLARQQNMPSARYATRRLEIRGAALHLEGSQWPLQIIVVPLLLGGLGVAGARQLMRRRSTARPAAQPA
jgi:putative intracellular protease/amidase